MPFKLGAHLLLAVLFLSSPVMAADTRPVKILATVAIEGAFPEIKPMVSKASGGNFDIEFAYSAAIIERLNKGEAADIVLLTKEAVAGLTKAGSAGPATDLVVSDIALAVADNAPKPVLKNAADFAAFMKSAPSIAYSATGASGIYLAKLFEQLGIADIVKAKATVIKEGLTANRLMKGEVAVAIQQVSELRYGGAHNIVLLPEDIQSHAVYTVAPIKASTRTDDQNAIIRVLTSKDAAAAFARSGVHPVFTAK